MQSKIRLLIADDSLVFREGFAIALADDPEITVVGQAEDGREAIALVEKLKPDVVTMDVVMPGRDGIGASRAILNEQYVPILLLTTLARSDEQRMALNAMRLGVLDILNKPMLMGEKSAAELAAVLRLVKAAARVKLSPHRENRKIATGPQEVGHPPRLIAIAASTGGPPAIERLLSGLPDKSTPIVVVLHLPTSFAESFAEWLGDASQRPVKVVTEDRERLKPGHIYIAADGMDMEVFGATIGAMPARANRPAPSADVLFSSIARSLGRSAVGVVLTGTGRDGAKGLKEIKQAGGWTIAQDETTSAVFGMPNAALQAGACCEVLPLDRISSSLAYRLGARAGERKP